MQPRDVPEILKWMRKWHVNIAMPLSSWFAKAMFPSHSINLGEPSSLTFSVRSKGELFRFYTNNLGSHSTLPGDNRRGSLEGKSYTPTISLLRTCSSSYELNSTHWKHKEGQHSQFFGIVDWVLFSSVDSDKTTLVWWAREKLEFNHWWKNHDVNMS